jgi:hypothetical protein
LLAVTFASELLTLGEPVALPAVPSTPLTGVPTLLGSVLGIPVATTDMPLGAAVTLAVFFGVVALTVKPEAGLTTPFAVIALLGVVALAARLAVLPVVYNEPSSPLPGVPAPAASDPLTPASALLTGSVAAARGSDPDWPLLPEVPPDELFPEVLPPELLACVPGCDDPEFVDPAELVPGELPAVAAPGVLADEPHPLAASRMAVNPTASVSLEPGVTMIPSRCIRQTFISHAANAIFRGPAQRFR